MSKKITTKNFGKNMAVLIDTASNRVDFSSDFAIIDLFNNLKKSHGLVSSMAQYCKNTAVYKENPESVKRVREFTNQIKGYKQEVISHFFIHCLERWANAPTVTHAIVSATFALPVLDDLLIDEAKI